MFPGIHRFGRIHTPIPLVLLIVAVPLLAHHSFQSEFDMDKPIHLEGKVTQLDWQNPHSYFNVDAADSSGRKVNWRVELVSPNDLTRLGMTRMTIVVGSDIVVDGFAAKAGAQMVGAMELTVKSSGKNLSLADSWKRFEVRPRPTDRNTVTPAK
jgi:hypothetical protein